MTHTYPAVLRAVTDGDTIRADLDHGCSIWSHNVSLRLRNVNAWELRNLPEGPLARDFLDEHLRAVPRLVITTFKRSVDGTDLREKFGRYLFDVRITTDGGEHWLSDMVHDAGHGRRLPANLMVKD